MDDLNTSFLDDPEAAIASYYASLSDTETDAVDTAAGDSETDAADTTTDTETDAVDTAAGDSETDAADTTTDTEADAADTAAGDSETDAADTAAGAADVYYDVEGDIAVIAADEDSTVSLSGAFDDDLVYEVSFGGSTYYVLFPLSSKSDLAVRNGVLVNLGTDTIYGCILDSDLSEVVSGYCFVLYPLSSSTGTSYYYRYGAYSCLRTYTTATTNNSTQYTSTDTYGSLTLVDAPSYFVGMPYAPYLIFACFVVAAFWLYKRLFAKKGVSTR